MRSGTGARGRGAAMALVTAALLAPGTVRGQAPTPSAAPTPPTERRGAPLGLPDGSIPSQAGPNSGLPQLQFSLPSNGYRTDSASPRYTVQFSGYSSGLDVAAREVLSIIAEDARALKSRRIEILSNPDGVAGDDVDMAGSRAVNARGALVRLGLPTDCEVVILSQDRGALPGVRGGAGLLREDQRIEIVVRAP